MENARPGGRVGKYELVELLGKGGMGEVWKARDAELGRVVALKLLQRTEAEDLARFRREAQVVARLAHPNVAQIYDVGNDPPYLAMQLIEGTPLSEPTAGRVAALRDAARAVHFAHQNGILHRDLKPANIMVDAAGRAYVLDFGLAREVKSDATAMTLSGDILGTPSYMAPEQARGDVKSLDARTDVYGLGSTLYFLMAGRPPHKGETAFDVVHAVINDEPARPGGERDLETICLKALEKEPRRRYASAADFADDLDCFLRNEPIAARPASTWYRLRKKIQRQPILWGLGGLLIASVAFGAFQIVRRSQREHQANADLERAGKETESRARVDEAQALLANVKSSLYVKGCTLVSHAAELAAARKKCEEALKLTPDYGPAWYVIGAARRAEGDPDEAVRALRKATQGKDAAPHMWAELGRALYESGNRHALRKMDTLEQGKIMSAAAREADVCFAKAGDFGKGVDAAVVGIYRRWNTPEVAAEARAVIGRFGDALGVEEAWYLLGIALDGDEAIDAYTRAIQIRPGYFLAYLQRGNEYDARRDFRRAIEDYDEAIRVKPDFVEAWINRGDSRDSSGDFTGAVEDYTRALKISTLDTDMVLINRAEAYAKLGDGERAFKDYDDVVRTLPDFYRAVLGRADALEMLGRHGPAIEDYGHAIALAPDKSHPYVNRGLTYIRLGEFRRAIEDLDVSIRLEKSNVESYLNRGLAYAGLKEFDRAIEDFDEAIRIKPDYLEAYRSRGRVHGSLRRYDLAVEDYTRALAVNPECVAALNDRGFAYGKLGDLNRAKADFAEALRKKPDNPDVYANRGFVLWRHGDLAAAHDDLTRALSLALPQWESRPTVEAWLKSIDDNLAPDTDF